MKIKINWRSRLKNKVTLLALIGVVVTFVYQVLGVFNVVPPISEADVNKVFGFIINILVGLGVIVNPNTKGISDESEEI